MDENKTEVVETKNLDEVQKNVQKQLAKVENNRHTVNWSISLETLGALLTIIFIILKLVGVISISWFWVFFPLWIVPAAAIAICLLVCLLAIPFLLIIAKKG